jgi:hypothetical protein
MPVFRRLLRLAAICRFSGVGCLIAMALALSSAPASACKYNREVFIGTDAERAAWEKRAEIARRAAVEARQKQFRHDVRTGKIDSATGLAGLLIPGARGWYLEDENYCLPRPASDGPIMPLEYMLEDAFKGSELEGLDGESLSNLASGSFVRNELAAFNGSCNEEFRAGFARRLRAEVSRRTLDEAYLVLSNSGERRDGYFRFKDAQRVTQPEAETWPSPGSRLSAHRRHKVTRVLQEFWADALPQLGTTSLVCPNARAQLVSDRETYLQRVRKRATYPRYLELAAKGREGG